MTGPGLDVRGSRDGSTGSQSDHAFFVVHARIGAGRQHAAEALAGQVGEFRKLLEAERRIGSALADPGSHNCGIPEFPSEPCRSTGSQV